MIDDLICDGRFDARLVRENKSAKGIFITLEIAADDYFAAKLSDVRPGALLKIGYQEIVDVSVQPIEIPSQRGTTLDQAFVEPAAKGSRGDGRERPAQPKKRFEDLPIVQQCAIRCDDEEFAKWFVAPDYGLTVAEGVRQYLGVKSRTELATNKVVAGAWRDLEHQYQNWLTDQKYGQARR